MIVHYLLTETLLILGGNVYWAGINGASADIEAISLADASPPERKE